MDVSDASISGIEFNITLDFTELSYSAVENDTDGTLGVSYTFSASDFTNFPHITDIECEFEIEGAESDEDPEITDYRAFNCTYTYCTDPTSESTCSEETLGYDGEITGSQIVAFTQYYDADPDCDETTEDFDAISESEELKLVVNLIQEELSNYLNYLDYFEFCQLKAGCQRE